MDNSRIPQSWLSELQDQVLKLNSDQSVRLQNQVNRVDWQQVAELVQKYVLNSQNVEAHPDLTQLRPAEFIPIARTEAEIQQQLTACKLGEEQLQQGRVGVLIVAGGQGSRLGYDGPKGTYPIGVLSGASLFYFHARKLVGLQRKFQCSIPLLVMTSPENDAQTRQHFEEHSFFGLNPDQVRFFQQGQLPAVDRSTGHPLYASPDRLALSPDGHGGCLYALSRKTGVNGESALDWVENLGVRTLFYYQVDNPMVHVADPVFLGLHVQSRSEVSFKVVSKRTPDEKVGVVCEGADGRKLVIEYSDLPESLARQTDSNGNLAYRAGSIAVHLFETEFLRRLAIGETRLPFHRALKKVAYWDQKSDRVIEPDSPNAIKFEAFIFDTLPLARRSLIVETDRMLEFEPLKNASGQDSPETVRLAMSFAAAEILRQAGYSVRRGLDSQIELDPALAFHPEMIRSRMPKDWDQAASLLIRE